MYYKTKGGGQFFKVLNTFEVKVVSLYDFNPVIERRRLSPNLMEQLGCPPCTEAEFNDAQAQAMQLLDLPPAISA